MAESTSNDRDGDIVVRMANKDEFRVPPPPSAPGPRTFVSSLDKGCPKRGSSVRAYYKPVVAFARQYLLEEEDHGEVHESLIGANSEKPSLADGVTIIVEPRGAVGELRVVYVGPPYDASGTRWAEAIFCLHVLQQGTRTTIAVEGLWQIYK